MVRTARKRSVTGIYHVMLRGIDKRDIFLDIEDRMKFIEKLVNAKNIAGFKLHGYCLMDNHVHLLIGEGEELGKTIKRITVGYVHWHNSKHSRVGHLFQNRYASEVIETEQYLLNVLRYIHQNPVKAGITESPKEYVWSSYNQYLVAYRDKNTFLNTELVKEYISQRDDFIEFTNSQTEDKFLEHEPTVKTSDEALANFIESEMGIKGLNGMPVEQRNKTVKEIYLKTGVSIRQLSRVLKIGKNTVSRAVK